MAITESLPVGTEVAAAPVSRAAGADTTAFAVSLAAASQASGGTVIHTTETPAAPLKGQGFPVKGQQDLPVWNAGDEASGSDGSGAGTEERFGQVQRVTDAEDASGAVSSLIGKREIVESAEAMPTKGDLQEARTGAGMQQAVWTAAAQSVQKTGTPGNGATDASVNGQTKLSAGPRPGPQLVSGPEDVLVTSTESIGEASPAAGVTESASSSVAANPVQSKTVVAPAVERTASSAGNAQSPAASPVEISETSKIPTTSKTVTAKLAEIQTTTKEPGKASGSGLLRTGEKENTVNAFTRKAGATAEPTLKFVDAGIAPSTEGQPGATLLAQASTPVTSAAVVSPVVSEVRSSPDGISLKVDPVNDAKVVSSATGVRDDPAGVSPTVARQAILSARQSGPNKTASMTAFEHAESKAKRSNAPGDKNESFAGDHPIGIAYAPADTINGSSVLPVVVGVAVAAPQVISASSVTTQVVVAGVGTQPATSARGQSPITTVRDKDGKNTASSVSRVAVDPHSSHPATAEPAAASSASTTPEIVPAGKNTLSHEAGSTTTADAMAGAATAGSNAHGTAVAGWNSGLVAATTARAEAPAATTTSSATGTVKAENGSHTSGLSSGLSSGLVESGQGHTTLQATPTVLEVGVPGGTHGWLKIRAELNESGTVQASVSSATEAGQDTLRKELPAMSAFLQSEHVPVNLQIAHGVATIAGGSAATGLSAGDGLASGLGSGAGGGSHAGAHPEQSRNDATTSSGVLAGSTDAGDSSAGRQQGTGDGQVSVALTAGPGDAVSAAVAGADAEWTSSQVYGGVSFATGGNWVNVVA